MFGGEFQIQTGEIILELRYLSRSYDRDYLHRLIAQQRELDLRHAPTGLFGNRLYSRYHRRRALFPLRKEGFHSLDREIAERKLSVDLTIFQTLQDYDRWKKQGVLMSFKPEGWDQIHQSFKDPDGQYVGVAVYALSYAYNTQAIAGIDVPRSAQDFLKPEFTGKVITCYLNDDDVTLYLFYTIVQKYGWDFMDKYMANNPQWVRGHLGTARAVARGQAAVTFDTMTNVTLSLKKNNQPTNVAFSDVDSMPIWAQTTAIFKDAPHPNAAKLYITWFLAKEQQSRTGTWSTRLDVPPPSGLKPIFDYQLANDFRSFITNEKLAAEMRKRFEGYIGKPKGQPVIH